MALEPVAIALNEKSGPSVALSCRLRVVGIAVTDADHSPGPVGLIDVRSVDSVDGEADYVTASRGHGDRVLEAIFIGG